MQPSKDLTPTQSPALEPATYRRLLHVSGFPQLALSALMTRTANQSYGVALILFILQRYHSPGLAGLGLFLALFPAFLTSPISGALLDRYGRKRLMVVDFTVAGVSLLVIVALAVAGALPPWLLLLILGLSSFTGTLSMAGQRSLFPLTVPVHLWDRANAVDSMTQLVAQIAGPAMAGLLTAWRGAELALVSAAAAYVVAIIALSRVPEPVVESRAEGPLMRESLEGLRYVLRNPSLRWLAVAVSTQNLGWGAAEVALPLLVFRLHGGAALYGYLLAASAAIAIPSSFFSGRLRTEGHERRMMGLATAVIAVSTIALAAPSLVVLALALMLFGLASGPLDVALFSLRQRRTNPNWYGRAFAISASLNMAGMPIGSALAGPLISHSLDAAVGFAAILTAVSALLFGKIPARQEVVATN